MLSHVEVTKRMMLFQKHIEIDEDTECKLWTGNTDKYGKPRFAYKHTDGRDDCWAYRFVWMAAGNECNKDMILTSLCGTIRCVNIQHIDELTPAQFATWKIIAGLDHLEGLDREVYEKIIYDKEERGYSVARLALCYGYTSYMMSVVLARGSKFLDIKEEGLSAIYT